MPRFPLSERWYRWSVDHAVGIDRTIAVGLSLLAVFAAYDNGPIELIVNLGLTVPLAWRRTHTVVAGGLVAVFAVAYLFVSDNLDMTVPGLCVPIAVYALAAYGPRWARVWSLPAAVVGVVTASATLLAPTESWQSAVAVTILLVIYVVAAWGYGDLRRVRTAEIDALTERARLLELERAQAAELAALGERTRIAREMHDIVAHSLTVVIAQADGGRYGATADPAAAVTALETIAETGRQALTDMRALLSVLREDRPRETRAVPQVPDIDGLVDDLRAGGLAVALRAEGEPHELSAGAGLTAYRIVQESLTNVLKHAGPAARVEVTVRWEDERLVLSIGDDGRGAAGALVPSTGGGQGVLGMRERAELHGGDLAAGPVPGGGYRVRAELPYTRRV